jgi:hypothetical protein
MFQWWYVISFMNLENGRTLTPQLICLIGVRLQLHEPEGDSFDRETCITAAKEAASLIKVWIRQLKSDESKNALSRNNALAYGNTSSKASSRYKHGTAGPYVLVPWFWTANRLIRSARMLRKLGREAEAAELDGDAAIVVQGLKDQGVLYPMAGEPAEFGDSAA